MSSRPPRPAPRARADRAPRARASRSSGSRAGSGGGADDGALVERDLLGPQHLVGLVALAGKQEGVTRAGLVEGRVNGGQTVHDPEMRHAAHALLDIVDDGAGILGAR